MDNEKEKDIEKLNKVEYIYKINNDDNDSLNIHAENNDKLKKENTIKKLFKEWAVPILAALALALAINKLVFFNIVVPTKSMYPTIKPNDRILVTRVHNVEKLKRGDVVVFHSDELDEELIKRLIGLPNDVIEINQNGSIYINNELQEEKYVIYSGGKGGKFKVPEESYFFLGDNRNNSLDSRYWDNPYIPKDEIMGKAQFIIKPFDRMGKLK